MSVSRKLGPLLLASFITLSLGMLAGCAADNGVCGDGIQDVGSEECDDGNAIDGDGCSSVCTIDDANICGDNILDPQYEECDDGNDIDGDGCDHNCLLEVGICGDGTEDPGEECDDGNDIDGDGCDHNCLLECDFDCGNGYCVDSNYTCDDINDCGNHADEQGCGGCTSSQFYCAADSLCIDFVSTCDTTDDCSDGQDEDCF